VLHQRLAAESGSPLLASLNQAIDATEDQIRYHEIPLGDDGKLTLMADDNGVSGVWSAPDSSPPPRLAALDHAGERHEATWQRGPEGHLQRTQPILPWVDGQVVLEIGTDPPRRLTISR
jgi:hypothetical protein